MKSSKLPSEKIREKFKELQSYRQGNNDIDDLRDKVRAIEDYLDEEYEKNKPCEHEETEVNLMLMMKECKKCKCIVS